MPIPGPESATSVSKPLAVAVVAVPVSIIASSPTPMPIDTLQPASDTASASTARRAAGPRTRDPAPRLTVLPR